MIHCTIILKDADLSEGICWTTSPRTFEQAASGTRSIRLAGERQGPFILPQTAGSHLDNSRSVYVQMHDSQTEQPQAENVLEPSQVLGKSRHHPWSRMRNLDPTSHGEGCAMVDYVWWRHWFEALKYIHHTHTHTTRAHTWTHITPVHSCSYCWQGKEFPGSCSHCWLTNLVFCCCCFF